MPADARLVERLYRKADAARWRVPVARFAEALDASLARGAAGPPGDGRAAERYLAALHLEDLALACACALGDEAAWEHFVLAHRPYLYRAADALAPDGGARDLADGLYAELFGLERRAGERQSLFRYFHGRSSLATWLRAVLAQRHIDRLRTTRRTAPLPEDDSPAALAVPAVPVDPGRSRCLDCLRRGLEQAVAGLLPKDRLRLGCYYAQGLKLAAIGRVLGEHEATVSRHLARTRSALRAAVGRYLLVEARMSAPEIADCLASVAADAGPLNIHDLLAVDGDRKIPPPVRSSTRTST